MPITPATEATADIAVLAKAPVAGWAKTRLIPALGAHAAARLQRRLTRDALQTAQRARLGDVTLWCAPDAAHPFFRALARRAAIMCRAQPEGDLGQRMLHAFQAQRAHVPLLLIGTDCPALEPDHLRGAAAALHSGCDAALMPASDGGYVLIGLRRPLPALFGGIAWSTDQVLAQTRARLRAIGARWHEGPTLADIDRPDDLRALPERLRERERRHG